MDKEYIRIMKDQRCADADLMLFCIKMSNIRFHSEDHDTITNLTQAMGKKIWDKVIFVLTFANHVVVHLSDKHEHHPGKKAVHELFTDLLRRHLCIWYTHAHSNTDRQVRFC